MKPFAASHQWDESTSACELSLEHTGSVFESFFERSVDAVWLLDPQTGVFVDCNQAAVELIGAGNKQELLRMRPDELSPLGCSGGAISLGCLPSNSCSL